MIVTAITSQPRRSDSLAAAGPNLAPKGPQRVITAQDRPPSSGEKLSFWDALDVVNPLQHIPIVSHFYRQLTGDAIKAPAQIAGGFLYGGPIGMALAGGEAALEKITGHDAMGLVMALVDPKAAPAQAAAVAQPGAPSNAAQADAVIPAAPRQLAELAPSAAPLPPDAAAQAGGNAAYQQALRNMAVAYDKYQAGQTIQNVSK